MIQNYLSIFIKIQIDKKWFIGKLCGPEEVGEIFMGGPYKPMKGYLNRPEENQKFFAGDNWYRTGDLARYDSNGDLYYEGRQKELIKYKNCHLYPLEIENVIR